MNPKVNEYFANLKPNVWTLSNIGRLVVVLVSLIAAICETGAELLADGFGEAAAASSPTLVAVLVMIKDKLL